ncbi:MAG: hypothetical protein C0501_18060 [Isosphaera sp.]|nr:hypothetical protein [Isosphaera sp.]
MRDEVKTGGPAAGATKPRLPARVFYGVIVAGVLLGSAAAAAGGWAYARDGEPEGRGVWADAAKGLVVPVAAMVGATFGGLAGVALAVALEKRS